MKSGLCPRDRHSAVSINFTHLKIFFGEKNLNSCGLNLPCTAVRKTSQGPVPIHGVPVTLGCGRTGHIRASCQSGMADLLPLLITWPLLTAAHFPLLIATLSNLHHLIRRANTLSEWTGLGAACTCSVRALSHLLLLKSCYQEEAMQIP